MFEEFLSVELNSFVKEFVGEMKSEGVTDPWVVHESLMDMLDQKVEEILEKEMM